MNVLEVEFPLKIEAKTSKYNDKTNVIYSVAELQHNFCINKKEIIMEQIKVVKTCLDILLIKVTVWLWKEKFLLIKISYFRHLALAIKIF